MSNQFFSLPVFDNWAVELGVPPKFDIEDAGSMGLRLIWESVLYSLFVTRFHLVGTHFILLKG